MNTAQNGAVPESSPKTSLRRVIRAAIMVLSVGFISCSGMAISTSSAASATDTGHSLFNTNCAVCHGQDGHGTATGKALNAADLNSEAVQKLTDAQVTKQIEDGKGNMPPFKPTLSASQIKLLVAYVHTFGKKKK